MMFRLRQYLHERGIGQSPMSDIAREVVRLLVADPYAWERSSSYIIHRKSRIGIWTRNECYGLHLILIPPEEINDPQMIFRNEVKIELTKAEKKQIYKFADWNKRDRKAALQSMPSC